MLSLLRGEHTYHQQQHIAHIVHFLLRDHQLQRRIVAFYCVERKEQVIKVCRGADGCCIRR